MTRLVKNIFCFSFILILVGSSFLIITLVENNEIKSDVRYEYMNANNGSGFSDMELGGNIPDKPPEMPSDSKPGAAPERPEEDIAPPGFEDNGPPSLPEGETITDDGPPDLPADINNGNNQNTVDDVKKEEKKITIFCSDVSFVYYFLLGIDGLLLSLVIIYLIFSKCNLITFKEIKRSSLFLFSIVGVLIITILYTIGFSYLLTYSYESALDKLPVQRIIDTKNILYNKNIEYSGNFNISDKEYKSDKENQVVFIANGKIDGKISNLKIDKTGDADSTDATSNYGYNSGFLIKSGATVKADKLNITTEASGSNGIFVLGNLPDEKNVTKLIVSNSTINTSKYSSGGLMVTNGGVIKAKNLVIKTQGMSSASIRTDHGGGKITVDGGDYRTTGDGSPVIYSTGNIIVKNSTLTSENSEGVVIDGANSVEINNSKLSCSNLKLVGFSSSSKCFMIHHSISDLSVVKARTTIKNSVINNYKGDIFFVTNLEATINLEKSEFVNNDATGNFMVIKADNWGRDGSNGGNVKLNLNEQKITGNIIVDKLSTLDMNMSNSSYFEGIINSANSSNNVKVKLDKNSKIKLTGNSYISVLDNSVKDNSNIDFNGFTLYVDGKELK